MTLVVDQNKTQILKNSSHKVFRSSMSLFCNFYYTYIQTIKKANSKCEAIKMNIFYQIVGFFFNNSFVLM
jgi:hypothetical protein